MIAYRTNLCPYIFFISFRFRFSFQDIRPRVGPGSSIQYIWKDKDARPRVEQDTRSKEEPGYKCYRRVYQDIRSKEGPEYKT